LYEKQDRTSGEKLNKTSLKAQDKHSLKLSF